jgi:hypothetical protein
LHRWHATYCWKNLSKGYNFALDLISIGSLHSQLWASKITGIPILRILRFSPWNLRTEWYLGADPMAKHKIYYKGEVGGFPQVRAMVSLVSLCLPMACPCTKVLKLYINQLVILFVQVRVSNWLFITLRNPHSKAPTHPSTPKVLQAKEHASTFYFFIIFTLDSHLSPSRSLGARHMVSELL